MWENRTPACCRQVWFGGGGIVNLVAFPPLSNTHAKRQRAEKAYTVTPDAARMVATSGLPYLLADGQHK